jgi:hypothetical protein
VSLNAPVYPINSAQARAPGNIIDAHPRRVSVFSIVPCYENLKKIFGFGKTYMHKPRFFNIMSDQDAIAVINVGDVFGPIMDYVYSELRTHSVEMKLTRAHRVWAKSSLRRGKAWSRSDGQRFSRIRKKHR